MGRRRSPPPPPPVVKEKTVAEERQEKKEKELDLKIEARKDAAKRKKRGRMSLISGDERGIKSTLG